MLKNLIDGSEIKYTVESIIRKKLSLKKVIQPIEHLSYVEAQKLIKKLGITSYREYKKWHHRTKQPTLPSNPHRKYKKEWTGYNDFFGTDSLNNMSIGEQRIKNYLERNGLEFVYQKKYDDCRNINPLPFDFYITKYNLIVEFDGYHHYGEVSKYDDSLDKVQKHDGIKNKYCEDNNINILRIPYWKLDENSIEWTLDNEISKIAAENAIKFLEK